MENPKEMENPKAKENPTAKGSPKATATRARTIGTIGALGVGNPKVPETAGPSASQVTTSAGTNALLEGSGGQYEDYPWPEEWENDSYMLSVGDEVGKFIGKVAHVYSGENKGIYDRTKCIFNF